MRLLIAGVLTLFVAFGAHVALWKVCVPRRQTRTLFLIFMGAASLVLLKERLGWMEAVYLFFFVGSIALAYASFYTTIEGSSPSLDILLMLDGSRAGVCRQEILNILNDDYLVLSRLDDLVSCGMARYAGGRYRLAPAGATFVSIFILFRRLILAGKGG